MMRFYPWAGCAALVLGMAVLAFAPVEALDALRWSAFFLAGAVLIAVLLKTCSEAINERRRLRPGAASQSAVLLVEIDGGVNAALNDAERTLVMEAIARSVRIGDRVTAVEDGTFAVHLEGATPALAAQVGNRICEEVNDQIVFDGVGRLMTLPVSIGGVIGSTERKPLPLNVARDNLVRARNLDGQKLLISKA